VLLYGYGPSSFRTYPDDPDERIRESFWTVTSEGVHVGVIVFHSTLPKPMWGWSITVQYPSPGIGKQDEEVVRKRP